ncbi:hypothetical protein [Aequorivita sinensis]|uniref:hypothetical protein n=1 Tax=Aequorivita sinensis TaxID=1382458 RepID=UPI00111E53DE|nr:hypothetical protein [Aequorivita sinensis]
MKILSLLCLILLLSGLFVPCTPTSLTKTNDVPTVVNTGNDDSVRPDNDKDQRMTCNVGSIFKGKDLTKLLLPLYELF